MDYNNLYIIVFKEKVYVIKIIYYIYFHCLKIQVFK